MKLEEEWRRIKDDIAEDLPIILLVVGMLTMVWLFLVAIGHFGDALRDAVIKGGMP